MARAPDWTVGRLFMMWGKSDLNIWINKFCPRIHGYRYTQKRWFLKDKTVWKSDTFFTISSSGCRRRLEKLTRQRSNPLWAVYLIQYIQLMAAIRIGFDGSFINFTALHLCVLSGPHTEPALPPGPHPSPRRHLEPTIYPEMRIIISIVSKHKWIVISPSSWDLNLLIYCEVSRKPSVQKLPKFFAANIDGRTLWHKCTAALQQ